MTYNVVQMLKKVVDKDRRVRILDMCSGTGCIALGIVHLMKGWNVHVTGIDINRHATRLSQLNQRLLKIPTTSVTFKTQDLYQMMPESFDIIISNPPYILQSEFASLDESVKEWEDVRALVDDGTNDGVGFYSEILKTFGGGIGIPGVPRVVFEYGGREQTATLRDLVERSGYECEIVMDMYGRDRVVYGW